MMHSRQRPNGLNLKRKALVATTLAGSVFVSGVALAQSDFPNKPIHFVVGFAARRPSDIISRVVGAKMGEILGQQVWSKTGPGRAARSQRTTWRAPSPTATRSQHHDGQSRQRDRFRRLCRRDSARTSPRSQRWPTPPTSRRASVARREDLAGVHRARKKQPGLLYATAGVGSATHLTSELFNTMAGVKTMPVHYRGGGDAMKDLLSGQVKMMFSSIAPVIGAVQRAG